MRSASSTIHLFNPMWDSSGSEWRTYELFRLLQPHGPVRLWSTAHPATVFRQLTPVRRIKPARLRFPWTGTFVFVGVYGPYRPWIHFARPRRIIVVYNTDDPALLHERTALLHRFRRTPVETVFASRWLRNSVGGTGPVQVSPIDLARFAPPPPDCASPLRPFTVGRHSRDIADKHHPDDPRLYREFLAAGMHVRLLGGTVLQSTLDPHPNLELRPVEPSGPERFLTELDCFLYRTAPGFREPHGRVVQEAMACGLPVVCDAAGGYAEYIEHGRNGFLFATNDEAAAIVARLRAEPALRQRIGAAARATVEQLFSPTELARVVDFYRR